MRHKIIILYFLVITLLVFARCNNKNTITEKGTMLEARREAPLGWVYLTIYQDSSFVFTLTGMRSDQTEFYPGKVAIRNDSLFFQYKIASQKLVRRLFSMQKLSAIQMENTRNH